MAISDLAIKILGPKKDKASAVEIDPSLPPKIDDNINKYVPIDGPTNRQLTIGLWWVRHRLAMRKAVNICLMVFCFITISYGFGGFGLYLYSGMPADAQLEVDTSRFNSNYNAIMARQPQDLTLGQVFVFSDIKGIYNFVAQIDNLNPDWYVEFDYYFVIDEQKTPVRRNFIMPKKTKYLNEFLFPAGMEPNQVVLRIENMKWQRIRATDISNVEEFVAQHLAIEVGDIKITNAAALGFSGSQFKRVSFSVKNNTPYNYWVVDLYIVSKVGNRILESNKYQLNKFYAGDKVDVSLLWTGQVQGAKFDIIPSIHIFDEENYIPFDFGSGQEK